MNIVAPKCFCGSSTSLRSNALIYNGKEYGNGKIWLCDRFPVCRGSVGTHPDGKPLGIVPDEETKKLRIKLHAIIDPLWECVENGRSRKRNRGSVYGWLNRIMGRQIHMGETTKQDCLDIVEAIKLNPYRKHEEPNPQ